MSDTEPRVLPLKGLADPPAGAVLVQQTEGLLHLSLWVHTRGQQPWQLHMTLDGLRQDDVPAPPVWAVAPAQDADVLEDLGRAARLLWQGVGRASIPYAFDSRGVRLRPDGTLQGPRGAGLSCASLILVLFEEVGAPLLALEEWEHPAPARRAQDERARQALLRALGPRRTDTLKRLAPQLGTPRPRPEEVAAASGMQGVPLGLTAAARGAAVVLHAVGIAPPPP